MTKPDMPERIWAAMSSFSGATMWWRDNGGSAGTEYVRADQVEALTLERDRLREALIEEREDNLWNAYHASGGENDGKWDHYCMSDGEWLARECGFDWTDRVYDALSIKSEIPNAAKRFVERVLKGEPE